MRDISKRGYEIFLAVVIKVIVAKNHPTPVIKPTKATLNIIIHKEETNPKIKTQTI